MINTSEKNTAKHEKSKGLDTGVVLGLLIMAVLFPVIDVKMTLSEVAPIFAGCHTCADVVVCFFMLDAVRMSGVFVLCAAPIVTWALAVWAIVRKPRDPQSPSADQAATT